MIIHRLVRGLWLAGAGSLLVVVTACGPGLSPTGAVAISPVAAQQARIWFYRDQNPNDPMATPYLRVDGAVAGVSVPDGASYRDVPAGRHQITVESYVNDGNQTKIVDLPPGSRSGLHDALDALDGVQGIATVRFNAQDVVRHPLVTKIVTAYDAYEAKRRGDAKPLRPK